MAWGILLSGTALLAGAGTLGVYTLWLAGHELRTLGDRPRRLVWVAGLDAVVAAWLPVVLGWLR
ncbi:MAG: hypothetical protein OWV35_06970 [Firmicutes bacterium]|nr:hypothetical protein [Bacillota bacterium]